MNVRKAFRGALVWGWLLRLTVAFRSANLLSRQYRPIPITQISATQSRGFEIASVLLGQVVVPLLSTTFVDGQNEEEFWSVKKDGLSNADRVVGAFETLGCTYIKFGQALASRPDIIPPILAQALEKLQDDVEPFDTSIAKSIIREELKQREKEQQHDDSDNFSTVSSNDLEVLLTSLSPTPVAAASIGQVYKAVMPGYGNVAVKVQRPGIRETVSRDAEFLRTMASIVESIPRPGKVQNRLVKAKLVDAVNEFMSRLEEELDYHNEVRNIQLFGELYSHRRKNLSNNSVRVIVPQVLEHLCTDHVLVMEWIDGTKLTDVNQTDPLQLEENLNLIRTGIECTLSQLFETGILHADPHSSNLIKVKNQKGKGSQLGYLDFGLLSSVPEPVRDALICSVSQLVFARNSHAVAELFGELQLLPSHVIQDADRCMELARALDRTFQAVLEYPTQVDKSSRTTSVPHLNFDRLLGSLAQILPEFEFQLPPYFLNNCRALATMEGNARRLDPSFSVLKVLYPYALNRLLLNPSSSPVVEATLWSLLINPLTNAVDPQRALKLLDDASAMTGFSRRKVALDILKTRKGRDVTRAMVIELAKHGALGRQRLRSHPTSYFLKL